MMNRWFAIHIILSLQCRDGPFVSPICIYMFYLQKATLRNPPRKRLLIYLVSLLVFHKCHSNQSTSHLIANETRIQVLWCFPSQAFGWASEHRVAFVHPTEKWQLASNHAWFPREMYDVYTSYNTYIYIHSIIYQLFLGDSFIKLSMLPHDDLKKPALYIYIYNYMNIYTLFYNTYIYICVYNNCIYRLYTTEWLWSSKHKTGMMERCLMFIISIIP